MSNKFNFKFNIHIFKGINAKAIIEFLIVAVVLCSSAYVIHCKVLHMINHSLEKNLLRHINTIVHSVDHEFNQELKGMHIGVSMVEKGEVSVKSLINVFSNAFEKGTDNSGILRMNGQPIEDSPRSLPEHEFVEVYKAFFGKDVISYHQGQGLIFAVPININNERCIFYQKYTDSEVADLFGVISFDGEGFITLANGENEVVALTPEKEIYQRIFNDKDFLDEFEDDIIEEIDKKDNKTKQAVSHYEFEGVDYLIFGAKNLNDDFAVFGIVPRSAVSVGIDYVHKVMLGGMVLLMLFLILYARYSIKMAENKELEQEKLTALQASKTKSEFLSNMSHEIRTPINAILGMDEMILRESKEANTIEYAENLRNAGISLLGLVNDILDFSKIEAGKMEIIPVEYQMSSLLNDLMNMIQSRADKKDLGFNINVDPNIPNELYGDEIRIKQVATNILTNAVKYTEKGHVDFFVECSNRSENLITLKFTVKDTGIGIKQEDIQKLFSAFERIEEKRNRTIEGTGLGMNITQKLLTMMNSQLKVKSVYGQGSEFSFELEQKIINAEPIGDFQESYRRNLKQRKTYKESFTAPNAQILVVDDTVMNLTVIKGLLKQTKIQIDTAESGYETLKIVTQKKYDIIFLDHMMPKMDGIETLKTMKMMKAHKNQSTPIIALTANAISGSREKYLSVGFNDYLSKPIESEQLEKMLMKYLPQDKISLVEDNQSAKEDLNLPEELKNLSNINVKEGIEHCGGIEEYIEALKIFANSINSSADEIEKYFNDEDCKNYTTKVHALKSSARVIGAIELSERAKRLEDAGNSNYINEIKIDTKPLLDLYRSYTTILKSFIEVEDDTDKPLIDEGELKEAFETMKEFASAFDYDSLMFVIQSLNDYKLPEDKNKVFNEIKTSASKLDWETINRLLK